MNSVRTNNFNDERIMQKISGMWKEASNLLNNDVIKYGVYYDYESNYKGDYTLAVAIETSSDQAQLQILDDSKYEVFKVDAEDEHGILNTWKAIWEREDRRVLQRAYTYDFEKYNPDGTIEIHIAVK